MLALTRTLAVARKELLQLRRDRLTLAMMVALPIAQLLLFGYAIDTDVRHVPAVVWDQDHSAASRDFAQGLQATGFYDFKGQVRDGAEIERAFRSGRAQVALVIPPRFEAALAQGRPEPVQLIVDGSDPQTVGSATSTAQGLAAARSPRAPQLRVEAVNWYNPDLKTSTNIVPGLVGVILTMTMVMLTAMAIARERERGTLEQLIVSPLRRSELVVGKIAPYVAIGFLQMTLILLLGRVIFGVPFRGSMVLLYCAALIFIAANLALGLLFSTLARTQQQAMQMSFFFLLPNILLSGFMFPFEAMPPVAQALAQALPLTHFLRIVRGVVLKAAALPDVAVELGWLGALLLVLSSAATMRFRKKLD